MKSFAKKFFGAAALAGYLMVGFGGAASATTCGTFVMNGVTPNIDCGIGGHHNDSETQLNADALFGQTSWTQIAKDD